MENRFKRLRYEDDLCFHEKITMSALAKEMEISKATIHNIEASDDYDAKTSILKLYHKQFPDISFDYLLGIQNTKERLSNHFEETLPFGNDYYTKLEILIKECHQYKEADRLAGKESIVEDIIPVFLEALVSFPTDFILSFNELINAMIFVRRCEKYEPYLINSFEYLGAKQTIFNSFQDFLLTNIMDYLAPMMDKEIEEQMKEQKILPLSDTDEFFNIPDVDDDSIF